MPKKTPIEDSHEVSIGNLVVNFDNFGVYVNGSLVELSVKEFEILRMLLSSPDKILPYSTFIDSLWDGPDVQTRQYLSVLVHRLRQKLAGSHPFVIKTMRSRGYGLIRERAASSQVTWRPA